MKKGFSIVIVLFLILFISCDKVITEFRLDSIDIDAYPRITDTVILRELIYNNPKISGINDYLRTKKYDDESEAEYEANRNYQIAKFDDFFWERANRDSLLQATTGERRPAKYLYFFRDSMTYRIIDTLSLKTHTGILIYLNSEERMRKELFLSIYNPKKELEETYLVAVKDEYPIKYEKGDYSLKTNTYSTLSSRNRLNVYITEENMEHEIGKKTEIHSVYDLNKLKIIKSDTVTTGEYPIMDAGGVLWR